MKGLGEEHNDFYEDEDGLCSICLCPPTDPYTLFVCGHQFCKACLQEFMRSASEDVTGRESVTRLPLKCIDCEKPGKTCVGDLW